jgi:hypothetical protein
MSPEADLLMIQQQGRVLEGIYIVCICFCGAAASKQCIQPHSLHL